MIWRSTEESIVSEQVSIFALIETVAAMAIAFAIYEYTQSLKYIAIAAILAPFLLLRTPAMTSQSANWVLQSQKFVIDWTFERNIFVGATLAMLWEMMMLGIGHLFVKFAVTALHLITRPLDSLRVLPGNWRRVVLYTDIFLVPELFPGIEKIDDDVVEPLKITWWTKQPATNPLIIRYTVGIPAVAILYLFAGLYRWSLKSTALIWSPLLWAFRPLKAAEHVLPYARGILRLTPYRIARWYSALVVFLFLFKMILFILWYQISTFVEVLPAWPLINHYLASNQLPLWQVASFLSALITFWIFVRAELAVHRADNGVFVDNRRERSFFQITFWVRNLLSAYTLVCVLYITVRLSEVVRLPPLHPLFFPWD